MSVVRAITGVNGSAGVATVILVALLLWLWWGAMHAGTDVADRELRALDDIAMTESALHLDVLSARTGMLRNYDPLVAETNALRSAVDRLRRTAAPHDPEIAAASSRLARLVDEEEQSTETFKSRNALLQNSLAYFGRSSVRFDEAIPSNSGQVQPLSALIGPLATAMLHLTLDTSPSVVADVDEHLRSISTQRLSPEDAALAEGLLAHARLLRRLLPATDDVLNTLFAVSGDREQAAIRALVLKRRSAAESSVKHIRYVLCAISLLLVGMLLFLGMRLRARALALRQRANIEHLIARISTRFINTRAHEIAAHVEQALAELATCIGADRAYFVVNGPIQVYGWCRDEARFPPGWPQEAINVAARFDASRCAIQVDNVGNLPPGDLKNALRAVHVDAWLCFPVPCATRLQGVLGFDTVLARARHPAYELTLLQMACSAITSAIDRELLEHDKERLEASLQQARRMETIGALASGIAHNFNNITGAILGHVETAQAQIEPGTRAAGNLSEIRRAGERARGLVEQILTFGRRSAVRRSNFCIEALIAETKSLLHPSLPLHINIVFHAAARCTMISGEPAQLQQVILNVCNNAVQAMDVAGTIEIEVGTKQIGRALRAVQGELTPGRYVVISIIDPGRGMDETMLERIFEPFFTTRLEGNGLGLAMVREIVLDHGGAVKVQSAPGAGSRFDIWLPADSGIEPAAGYEIPGPVRRGFGETVLVLETNRERLLRQEEILAALGYEPVGFTHADEAAAACGRAPSRFDAALLCSHLHGADIALDQAGMVRERWVASWPQPPLGRTALDHAAALRERAPGLPIILATASVVEFGAPSLADVGIWEVIRQPVTTAELAGALARCLSFRNSPRHLDSLTADHDVVAS
jgi:signal transduction histidine kinase